jgi:hypothetical protein
LVVGGLTALVFLLPLHVDWDPAKRFTPSGDVVTWKVWEFKSLGSFLVWGEVLGDGDLTALSIALGVAVSVAAAALTYFVVGATRQVRHPR